MKLIFALCYYFCFRLKCIPIPISVSVMALTAHRSKEAWLYMKAPQKLTHKEAVKDITKLKASSGIDGDMLQGLIGEEGFMRAGAMPSISTASAAGSKQILDALAKASLPKKRC